MTGDGPDPLDDRIMALTEGLPEEQQQAIRAPLAFIREAWRGADYYSDIGQALEVIQENAAEIRRQLAAQGAEPRPVTAGVPKCLRVIVTAIYADGTSVMHDIPQPIDLETGYTDYVLRTVAVGDRWRLIEDRNLVFRLAAVLGKGGARKSIVPVPVTSPPRAAD